MMNCINRLFADILIQKYKLINGKDLPSNGTFEIQCYSKTLAHTKISRNNVAEKEKNFVVILHSK